jgi:hypothetical protein
MSELQDLISMFGLLEDKAGILWNGCRHLKPQTLPFSISKGWGSDGNKGVRPPSFKTADYPKEKYD